MSQKRWVVGVDVGGTFTDLFVLDEQTGTARIVKVPSTRGEEARGFMNGIQKISEDGSASGVASIVHGTTVGTNALLERKVARTGIITTRGFRDVLERCADATGPKLGVCAVASRPSCLALCAWRWTSAFWQMAKFTRP